MRAETRQTLIGVVGLTVVMIVALTEGYNGRVTVTYFIAIIALIAPKSLQDLPFAP